MGKATLVVMAAGIGSRYGGIKQLAQVGPNGEVIVDYAVRDAVEAGFDKVVFVIRRDLEEAFKELIGRRVEQQVETAYVYQEIWDVPEQYREKCDLRKKPWGTGQAILCCKDVVKEPFLVVNSDDYYGKEAYREAYTYLIRERKERENDNGRLDSCMVGFILGNTLSMNGGVTRGICEVDREEYLLDITETHHIVKTSEGAVVETENGKRTIDMGCTVSMNMWGLTPEIFPVLQSGFEKFLAELASGEEKEEYLLPNIIGGLLQAGRIQVKVLRSHDQWLGVTYQEDRAWVENELRKLR